jgi:hypothetical protein
VAQTCGAQERYGSATIRLRWQVVKRAEHVADVIVVPSVGSHMVTPLLRQRLGHYLFATALLVGLLVLSVVADRSAGEQRIITGIVTEWRADEFIAVTNESMDPGCCRISLRNTVYEGDTSTIKPGVRVTVWYRSVGERRPVADKLRVLDTVTH